MKGNKPCSYIAFHSEEYFFPMKIELPGNIFILRIMNLIAIH